MIGRVIFLVFILSLLGAIGGLIYEMVMEYKEQKNKKVDNKDIRYDWEKVGYKILYGSLIGLSLSFLISLIMCMTSKAEKEKMQFLMGKKPSELLEKLRNNEMEISLNFL
jgi:uncharacterized membrane protein